MVLKDAEEVEGRIVSWLESEREEGIFATAGVELGFELELGVVCLLCLGEERCDCVEVGVVFGDLFLSCEVVLAGGEACDCGEVGD